MAINLRAVAVLLVFVGGFAVLLTAAPASDTLIRAALWVVMDAISVVALALTIMIWSGADQAAVVPKRLRQWLLGERNH